MLQEILVGTALGRHEEIDEDPSLVGQLIHLREAAGHTIFPFCDVMTRATASQQETADHYEG